MGSEQFVESFSETERQQELANRDREGKQSKKLEQMQKVAADQERKLEQCKVDFSHERNSMQNELKSLHDAFEKLRMQADAKDARLQETERTMGADSEKMKSMDDQLSTLYGYIEQIGQNILNDASEGNALFADEFDVKLTGDDFINLRSRLDETNDN